MTNINSTCLLIDAGNSRLKWALYRQGALESVGHVDYGQASRPGSRQSSLKSQLSVICQSITGNGEHPARIVASNVAGPWLMETLEQWVEECVRAGLPIKDGQVLTIDNVVARKEALGVKNAYLHPERLGADRWAGLIAARHLVSGDCCIIDDGSALTVDVLTASGDHMGGIIIPGRQMMKKSLEMDTDAIGEDIFRDEISHLPLLGKSTREAVEAGVAMARAGAVMHVIEQYQEESGSGLHCVVTGGGARHLLAQLLTMTDREFQYEPDWVLKGLAVIADEIGETDVIDNYGIVK